MSLKIPSGPPKQGSDGEEFRSFSTRLTGTPGNKSTTGIETANTPHSKNQVASATDHSASLLLICIIIIIIIISTQCTNFYHAFFIQLCTYIIIPLAAHHYLVLRNRSLREQQFYDEQVAGIISARASSDNSSVYSFSQIGEDDYESSEYDPSENESSDEEIDTTEILQWVALGGLTEKELDTHVESISSAKAASLDVGNIQARTVSKFANLAQLLHSIKSGNWTRVSLCLTGAIGAFFPDMTLSFFSEIVSRCFRKIVARFPRRFGKATRASGLFGDIADGMESLQWVSEVKNWHAALSSVVSHLFVLPLLKLEKLVTYDPFLRLLDEQIIGTLKKATPLAQVESFIEVTKDFCRAIDNWLEGTPDRYLKLNSVTGWATEVEELYKLIVHRSDSGKVNSITYAEFNRRVIQCQQKQYSYLNKGPHQQLVNQTIRTLRSIESAQARSVAHDTSKPLVLALTGVPGVGKTESAKHLSRHILKKRPEYKGLSDEAIDEMLFCLTATTKWMWEGYKPEIHQAVFIDEVGTIANASNPIQPIIMQKMEHGGHITEQASADLKGKIPFTSKLIIICNNSPHFGLDQNLEYHGVTDKAAWFRRIDMHVHSNGIRDEFKKEGSFTVRDGIMHTLNIATWHDVKHIPQSDGSIVPQVTTTPLMFTDVLGLVDKAFNKVQIKRETTNTLSAESTAYYACLHVPGSYSCDCCERCSLCSKNHLSTDAPCSIDCKWAAVDPTVAAATDASPEETIHGAKASSFSSTVSFIMHGPTYWQRFGFACRDTYKYFYDRFGFDQASTSVSSMSDYAFFSLFSLGLGLTTISPVFFAWTAVLTIPFYVQTHAYGYDHHEWIIKSMDFVLSNFPKNFPVPPAAYAKLEVFFRTLSILSLSLAFSSVWNLAFSTAIWYVTGMGVTSSYALFFSYLGYSFSKSYSWFQSKLDRNGYLRMRHNRKLKELGIDPVAVHAAMAVLGTFFLTYITVKTLFPSSEREESHEREVADPLLREFDEDSPAPTQPLVHQPKDADIVFTRASSCSEKYSIATPFLDVHMSRQSVWDRSRSEVVLSKHVISADSLTEKIAANCCVITVEGNSVSRVTGCGLYSDKLMTVYHCTKDLLQNDSRLKVQKRVNGELQTLSRHNYTKDGVTLLPQLLDHVDQTNDIVALSLKIAPFKDLRKYVVLAHGNKKYINARIVYTDFEGIVHHADGSAVLVEQPIVHNGEVIYTAPTYMFIPGLGHSVTPYQGICGGIMLATAHNGQKAGIIGVINSTISTASGDKVGALPINMAGIDKISDTLESPISFPESIGIAVTASENNKHTHSYHARKDGNIAMYGTTEIIGCVPDSKTYPESRVQDFGWTKDIKAGLGLSHNYVAPIMGKQIRDGEYISPGKNAIKDLAHLSQSYSLLYNHAAVKYRIEKNKELKHVWDVYSILGVEGVVDACISGVAGSAIHNGIKRTTSAGYGYPGRKADYLLYNEDQTVRMNKLLETDVEKLLEMYEKGQREGLITRGVYKDEPRAADKVAAAKVRLFNPPQMHSYVAEHMLLSSLTSISVLLRDVNGTLGGMNCFSNEWSLLRERLESDFPFLIAGDFSKFDKSASFLSMYSTYLIDIASLQESKFFKDLEPNLQRSLLRMYQTLATEMSDHLVIIDGELLRPGHGNGSGSADTYKKNCDIHDMIFSEASLTIVDLVARQGKEEVLAQSADRAGAIRLAHKLDRMDTDSRLSLIRDNVIAIKHGDDGLYCTNAEYAPLFNFGSYKQGYAAMNLKFTPPDKGDSTYYTRTWDEIDIGKRTFLWNEELGRYTAPLSEDSIAKMLTIGVVNDMTIAEKRIEAVADATREYTQYGRAKYDDYVTRMVPICAKWNVPFSPLGWEEAMQATEASTTYTARGVDPDAVTNLQSTLDRIVNQPRD